MSQKFSIAARSALMANILAGDTSLTVDIAKADLFPVADTGTDPVPTVGKDWFKIVLEDSSHNIEIVYVRTRTLGSANMTNLLRGQEGTTARSYLAGSIVGLRHTATDLADAISFATGASSFWRTLVGWTTDALSRTALGVTSVGDAIFTAASAATARTTLSVAPRATRIDVASVAGTVDLTANAPDSDDIRLTGALAITAFTIAVGRVVRVTASGAFTLTNNANIVTQTGANIVAATGDTFMLRATASNVVEVLSYSGSVATQAGTDNSTKEATTAFVQRAAIMGQCYLSLSGGNLKLSPFQGNNLTINGVANAIPSAGVTLAPTGLTVSALYYIYAYMSGATMTLEASTTGHATDTTTGVEIKSGDATRTLVGMCVPQTGPAFADSGTKRLVLSWFNRRNKEVNNLSIAGGTTGSATAQEINSSDRILFLSWANDAVNCYANVSTTSNNSGCTWAITLGLDGTGYGYTNFNGGTAIGGPVSLSTAYYPEVSEGSHYATVMGQISGGNTLTVQGGGTSTIRAIVRG